MSLAQLFLQLTSSCTLNLSLQYHPDVNKGAHAEAKFITIGQAYEFLVSTLLASIAVSFWVQLIAFGWDANAERLID